MQPERSRFARAKDKVAASADTPVFKVVAFLAVQIPIALAIRSSLLIGTVHAMVTAAIGLWWAMHGRRPERVAYAAAYIAGSEVLWRMVQADVFWEFAKYAIVSMFLISTLRSGRLKGAIGPLLYFVLLLPSSFLTLEGLPLQYARRQLSFNLSGPFAILASIWFFSNLKLTKPQLHQVFLALLGPVVGLAAVTISRIMSAGYIEFTGQSNVRTSGGFGPNQVAAILGLGAFLCFFYLLHDKTSTTLKPVLIGCIVVLTTQSAMTFSRGGVYAAAGSAALAALYLIRERRGTARLLQVAPILFVVAVYIVVPQVVAFTGGAITERFKKTNLTRRGDLMEADVRIWQDNPLFGVGPGMGADLRGHEGEHIASHTEFSRMLSEHGVLGLAALLVLLAVALRNYLQAANPGAKALALSMTAWSFLFMSSNGMRLVAPSFIFGLAFVTFQTEKRAVRRVLRVREVGQRE